MLLIRHFVIIFVFKIPLTAANSLSSIPQALKSIKASLSNPEYSPDVRPVSGPLNATVVRASLYLRELDDIDDMKMQFRVQITFRMKWSDPRLVYNMTSDLEYVFLDEEARGKIWIPDLFFGNEASSFLHMTVKPNRYIRLYPDGQVIWSSRFTVIFLCPMDFKYFPFDQQRCQITTSSYSQTRKELIVMWDDGDANPVQITPGTHVTTR
jgi:hypothetical protein